MTWFVSFNASELVSINFTKQASRTIFWSQRISFPLFSLNNCSFSTLMSLLIKFPSRSRGELHFLLEHLLILFSWFFVSSFFTRMKSWYCVWFMMFCSSSSLIIDVWVLFLIPLNSYFFVNTPIVSEEFLLWL